MPVLASRCTISSVGDLALSVLLAFFSLLAAILRCCVVARVSSNQRSCRSYMCSVIAENAFTVCS